MEKFRKICLPCDLPQWSEIKKLLVMTRSASAMEAWIHRLQKVYNVVHLSGFHESDESKGAKLKSPSVFQGLSIYLNSYLSADSRQRYLNELLPFLVDRALQIETFSAECDFVVPDGDTTIVLTRACACSLLACLVLCIFPDQNNLLTSRARSFAFEGLYKEIASDQNSDVGLQKLDCIFQYYELVSKNLVDASEEIIFVRQILKNIPALETWLNSQLPLCHLQVICSEVDKVRHNKSGHLILFGEESFGSHVLGKGSDEMEICFVENPELISAMVFFDPRVENEVVMVRGATRFTTFPPRPSTSGLHSSGGKAWRSQQPQDQPTICCAVLPHASSDRKSFVYRHKTVVRTSGKMLSAFQQLSMDKSRFEEEEEDDDEDRALPSKMEVDPGGPMMPANDDARPPSLRSQGSRRMQPWRSQSSSGSSGSVDWTRRTLSFELESSVGDRNSSASSGSFGAIGTEEVGGSSGSRRRSSGLHSISRRSSGLSYQLSEEGGAYSRRRSSAMSETSQKSGFSTSSSSSSGKRSSTDYSSEMEEYFDSFQKRISIKTSVIEEETSGLLEEQGKLTRGATKEKSGDHAKRRQVLPSQRSLRRFVGDQPLDAVRPTPVKYSSLDLPMMAIDNFTDNLINQVAQDSRDEIAKMVAKESERRRIRTHDLQHERVLLGPPKFLRRGHSADLFNFKTKEIYRKPKQTTPRWGSSVEKLADAVSRRIVASAISEMMEKVFSRGGGGTRSSSSVAYETPKSLEEFAGSFVEGIFGEAFAIVGGRNESSGRTRVSKADRRRRGFFVDERQLKVYRRKEGDKRHVCTGSICFEEEEDDYEDFEEEEDDDDEIEAESVRAEKAEGAFSSRGAVTPLRPIGRSLSSGFRDPVLSDFEDLLVRSCINSPGRIAFASGEGSACGGWNDGTVRLERQRKPWEAEVAAVCSGWFSGTTGGGPYDGYAEHFVVEIFQSAVCQLLDGQTTMTSASHPSLGFGASSWQTTVDDYAANLVQCILEGAMIDLERRTASSVGAVGPRGPSDVKALAVGKEDWSVGLGDPALIGHYRVGIYGDDPEIQALLYWLCASYMGLPSLVYYSHGNVQMNRLSLLAEAVLSRDWSVGTLFSELLLWCSTRVDQSQGSIIEGLVDFLLLRRLK